jgi:hypothetical protein
MKSAKFTDTLVPEKEHGIPIKDCQPFVVFARAIEIQSDVCEIKKIQKNYDHKFTGEQRVTFEIESEGVTYRAKQTFHTGDVVPELGQWVRGVMVQCQWFSSHFIMTHLTKPKGKK